MLLRVPAVADSGEYGRGDGRGLMRALQESFRPIESTPLIAVYYPFSSRGIGSLDAPKVARHREAEGSVAGFS